MSRFIHLADGVKLLRQRLLQLLDLLLFCLLLFFNIRQLLFNCSNLPFQSGRTLLVIPNTEISTNPVKLQARPAISGMFLVHQRGFALPGIGHKLRTTLLQVGIQTVQTLLFTWLINITQLPLVQPQLLLALLQICTTLLVLLIQLFALCGELGQLSIGLLQLAQAVALYKLLSLIQQASCLTTELRIQCCQRGG